MIIGLTSVALSAGPDLSVRYARGSDPVARPWLEIPQHEVGGAVGAPVHGRWGVSLAGWARLASTRSITDELWRLGHEARIADPDDGFSAAWPLSDGGAALLGTFAVADGVMSLAEEAVLGVQLSVHAGPELRRVSWYESGSPSLSGAIDVPPDVPDRTGLSMVFGPRAGVQARLGGAIAVTVGADVAVWWMRSAAFPDHSAGHEVSLAAGLSWQPARDPES